MAVVERVAPSSFRERVKSHAAALIKQRGSARAALSFARLDARTGSENERAFKRAVSEEIEVLAAQAQLEACNLDSTTNCVTEFHAACGKCWRHCRCAPSHS